MGSNLSARVKVSVRLFNPLIIELFFIIISTKSRKREKGPYARLRADPSMQPSSRRKLWLRGPVEMGQGPILVPQRTSPLQKQQVSTRNVTRIDARFTGDTAIF